MWRWVCVVVGVVCVSARVDLPTQKEGIQEGRVVSWLEVEEKVADQPPRPPSTRFEAGRASVRASKYIKFQRRTFDPQLQPIVVVSVAAKQSLLSFFQTSQTVSANVKDVSHRGFRVEVFRPSAPLSSTRRGVHVNWFAYGFERRKTSLLSP